MHVRSILLSAASLLLIVSAPAHYFGWHQFDGRLDAVDPRVVAGMRVGWNWGSAAFAGLGATMLMAALAWRRHGRDPRPVAIPIAATLVVFGTWAFVSRQFNPHFLAFIVVGMLADLSVVGRIDKP